MAFVRNSIELATELLHQGQYAALAKKARNLLYEKRTSYGLRRDLDARHVHTKAKIPISIRKLEAADLSSLIPNEEHLGRKERVELASRRRHLDADIPQCYVAVDQRDGSPCYFQWLMGPRQNDNIQHFFGAGWFPILHSDEALLENAYTPKCYRGNGIMSEAMALIAERAADLGCRYVVTFVETDNVPSLKGCQKAGFAPYVVRTEHRMCFHQIRTRRLSGLPDSVPIGPF